MPLHIEIQAPLAVIPFNPPEKPGDDGKEIVIPVGDQVFHYKMTADLAREIGHKLLLSNDEIAGEMRKEALRSSIALPGGLPSDQLMRDLNLGNILGNGQG